MKTLRSILARWIFRGIPLNETLGHAFYAAGLSKDYFPSQRTFLTVERLKTRTADEMRAHQPTAELRDQAYRDKVKKLDAFPPFRPLSPLLCPVCHQMIAAATANTCGSPQCDVLLPAALVIHELETLHYPEIIGEMGISIVEACSEAGYVVVPWEGFAEGLRSRDESLWDQLDPERALHGASIFQWKMSLNMLRHCVVRPTVESLSSARQSPDAPLVGSGTAAAAPASLSPESTGETPPSNTRS